MSAVPRPPGKSYDHVRLALVHHLLIANWPGSPPVFLPLRWEGEATDAHFVGPILCEGVSTTSRAMDYEIKLTSRTPNSI
jgi:hypothetical protein